MSNHQKTALADGFYAAVDGKLTIVPQTVHLVYHKIDLLSKNMCLRGPDGSRTRIFYLRNRWSAINLPAQFTEAGGLLQSLDLKVNTKGKISSEYE